MKRNQPVLINISGLWGKKEKMSNGLLCSPNIPFDIYGLEEDFLLTYWTSSEMHIGNGTPFVSDASQRRWTQRAFEGSRAMSKKDRVRALLLERMKMGKPIDAQLRSLANRAPSTLIDMTIGLNPIGGTALTYALCLCCHRWTGCEHFPFRLSTFICGWPRKWGRERCTLGDSDVCIQKKSGYVLSQQIEGALAGKRHLMAIYDQPYFHNMCNIYVQMGARESLLYCSSMLGRVEPAIALLTWTNGSGS